MSILKLVATRIRTVILMGIPTKAMATFILR
jgi:hypothetical protein